MRPTDVLLRKLKYHSRLDGGEIAEIHKLNCRLHDLAPGQDFIHQGDRARDSAIVVEGMVGRYHTLKDGGRQYLSVHIAGDWPDAQGLFLERMDHSVCAMNRAMVCAIPRSDLVRLFKAKPAIGFAIWRETLIDAAIFREAITNNSRRSGMTRLAHFFAEIFVRSETANLAADGSCRLPLSQTQLGEMLGMSIATVNRHLQALRKKKAADLRGGRLVVTDRVKLFSIGDFDPLYLHVKVQRRF